MALLRRCAWLAFVFCALACVFSVVLWGVTVVREFSIPQPYWEDLRRAAPLAFSATNLEPLTWRSMYWGAGGALLCVALMVLMDRPENKASSHRRGATTADVETLKRMTSATTLRNRLRHMKVKARFSATRLTASQYWKLFQTAGKQATIGTVPIPVDLEPLHFLMVGSTGAGKSQAIKELLEGAHARGDRMIIVDPNGDYYSAFGARDDVILNPFDDRSPGWSIFNEIRNQFDCERYSRSVIPEGTGELKEWHGYAQFLFKETLQKLYLQGCRDTKVLLRFVSDLPVEQLKTYLADTAAAGLFSDGGERSLGSTRFIATRFMAAHKYLREGGFSLRTWLEAGQGNLYITWREDMADALRPLISTWYDILITSALSAPVTGEPRPAWYVCDELASMERLSSLEAGLTKGRKHGARFLSGIQSTAQLDALYGKEGGVTLRSCYRNVLFLNVPNTDPQTAEELSKGLGETEFLRKEVSRSLGYSSSQRTVSHRNVTERLVLPSQIHDLPNLEGFLCLAGDYPVCRVKLAARLFPKIAVPFVERKDFDSPFSQVSPQVAAQQPSSVT